MKRIIAFMLSVSLVLWSGGALGEGAVPDIGESRAAAVCSASGRALLEIGEPGSLGIAGLSRLPALLFVSECIDSGAFSLDGEVTVSEEAAAQRGPTAFISPYERINAGELYRAAVMISAADAIFALAQTAAGGESAAVSAISQRLGELGINSGGDFSSLSGEAFTMSAAELARLGAALAASPAYMSHTGLYMENLQHENGALTELVNPNRLIRSGSLCTGGSTGSSDGDGYSGFFIFDKDGTKTVCAVIGARNDKARQSAALALSEYSFSAFNETVAVKKGDAVGEEVEVKGALASRIMLIAAADANLILKSGEGYTSETEISEPLEAPILAGDAVGYMDFIPNGGSERVRIALTVGESIPRAGLFDYACELMRRYVRP